MDYSTPVLSFDVKYAVFIIIHNVLSFQSLDNLSVLKIIFILGQSKKELLANLFKLFYSIESYWIVC